MTSVSPSGKAPVFDSEEEMEDTCRAIFALASPARLRLLYLLQMEELAVVDLTRCLNGHTQSSISQHLNALRKAGVVSCRKQGTRRLYRMDDARLGPILNLITDVFLDRSERASRVLH